MSMAEVARGVPELRLAEHIGAMIAQVLLSVPAVVFCLAARTAKLRSTRLANLGLGLGLGAFVVPASCGYFGAPLIGEMFRAVLGLSALGLGLAASTARRHDGGGVVRPIIAGALGLLMAVASAAPLAWTRWAPTRPVPWTYRAPDGSYGLILPSARWSAGPADGPAPQVRFSRERPTVQATVVSVEHGKTEHDFDYAFGTSRIAMQSKLDAHAAPRDGVNPSGNRYRYTMLVDADPSNPKQQVFVAECFTWNPTKQLLVEIQIEAPMPPEADDAQNARAQLTATSDTICQGVQ